jgi:hypothetical protein
MMLRPNCIEQTTHVFCVLQWARHYEVNMKVLVVSAFMGEAPSWHPHILTLSSFAKEHSVQLVPIATQKLMGCLPADGPAIQKLERAEHIPVLGQKVLAECLSFLFALFKSHCGPPHVFINETRKLCRNGWGVMIAGKNTPQTPKAAAIEINISASSALEKTYEHKTIRTDARRVDRHWHCSEHTRVLSQLAWAQ